MHVRVYGCVIVCRYACTCVIERYVMTRSAVWCDVTWHDVMFVLCVFVVGYDVCMHV